MCARTKSSALLPVLGRSVGASDGAAPYRAMRAVVALECVPLVPPPLDAPWLVRHILVIAAVAADIFIVRRHVHCAGVVSEAVGLSTGAPIPAQWACRRRCRYGATA